MPFFGPLIAAIGSAVVGAGADAAKKKAEEKKAEDPPPKPNKGDIDEKLTLPSSANLSVKDVIALVKAIKD